MDSNGSKRRANLIGTILAESLVGGIVLYWTLVPIPNRICFWLVPAVMVIAFFAIWIAVGWMLGRTEMRGQKKRG